MVEMGQNQMTRILNDLVVVKGIQKLISRDSLISQTPLAQGSLLLVSDVDFGRKCLGLELTFVRGFDADTLVI